jgi:hypothetical protein
MKLKIEFHKFRVFLSYNTSTFAGLLYYGTQFCEAFTDRFTHLGNLFVAVGNPNLSNKMASYTADQKVFVIKTIYATGCSYVAVERQYHRKLPVYRHLFYS